MLKVIILFVLGTAFCVAYGEDVEQPECPENEVFNKCGKPCPEASCETPKPPPCLLKSCRIGCFCQEGYVRNKDNKCVLLKDCKSECKCPKNEVYKNCGKPCPEASCEKPKPPPCFIESCRTGCFCQEGYVRNKENKCVLLEDCKECGVNEIYRKCGKKSAEPTCKKPKGSRSNQPCKKGCFCLKGFVRNSQNKCVPKELCSMKCKKNSYPSLCPDPCPATCAHTKPLPCKKKCTPGCQCEQGYVLDKLDGKCVKIERCKDINICSKNETWTNCNPNCSDQFCPIDDEPQPVCDAPIDCPGGCQCKINYRRHPSGECHLSSECPPVECTRQNEIWNPCPDDCNSEYCTEAYDPPVTCNTLLLNCQPKCTCKENHYRNEEGLCVPRSECPRVCKDPNATFKDCPEPCPGTCQHTLPIPCDKPCSPGCQCNEGYVLSVPDNICVPITECADNANCGPNQVFVDCNHRCPGRLCPRNDGRLACRPPNPCAGGCSCAPGYRWKDNVCVLASKCPKIKCTRPNEYFHPCSSPDLLEECEYKQNQEDLPPTPPEDCNPWCICKKGFYRNSSYICVPADQCPTTQ